MREISAVVVEAVVSEPIVAVSEEVAEFVASGESVVVVVSEESVVSVVFEEFVEVVVVSAVAWKQIVAVPYPFPSLLLGLKGSLTA